MDPLNSTKKQEDFSPTEVSMEENTSADSPKKVSLLDWGLIALLIVGVAAIVTTAIIKFSPGTSPNATSPDTILSQSEILALRKEMSNDARGLANVSAPGSVFIANMTAHIDSAPKGNARRSLEIYLIYLSLRHGFYEDAIAQYDSYMEDRDSLSAAEICQLSEYRLLVRKYYATIYDNMGPVEADRDTYCANTLSQEEYTQTEGESDLDYGVRLFQNGFMTEAVSRLEKTNDSSLDQEELIEKYNPLLEFYKANADLDKYYQIVNGSMEDGSDSIFGTNNCGDGEIK